MARKELDVVVINTSGVPVSGASVLVNIRGGSAATVYTTEAGGGTAANPVITDASGRTDGWLDEGSYDLVISHASFSTYTEPWESISGAAILAAHKNRHKTGGADPFAVTDLLDGVARVQVKKDGSTIGTRRGLNFLTGARTTLTIADDSGNEEVEVTIASSEVEPYRKTASTAVNTTVTATDLLNDEITIAAAAMGTNKKLRLTAEGDWKQNSGGTDAPPRLQLELGGTVILDTGTSGNFTNSATRMAWTLEATIQNVTATTQNATLEFRFGSGTVNTPPANAFTTGTGRYDFPAANGPGQAIGVKLAGTNDKDTTGALTLKLKVINGSANANYETKLFSALVEIL